MEKMGEKWNLELRKILGKNGKNGRGENNLEKFWGKMDFLNVIQFRSG